MVVYNTCDNFGMLFHGRVKLLVTSLFLAHWEVLFTKFVLELRLFVTVALLFGALGEMVCGNGTPNPKNTERRNEGRLELNANLGKIISTFICTIPPVLFPVPTPTQAKTAW